MGRSIRTLYVQTCIIIFSRYGISSFSLNIRLEFDSHRNPEEEAIFFFCSFVFFSFSFMPKIVFKKKPKTENYKFQSTVWSVCQSFCFYCSVPGLGRRLKTFTGECVYPAMCNVSECGALYVMHLALHFGHGIYQARFRSFANRFQPFGSQKILMGLL